VKLRRLILLPAISLLLTAGSCLYWNPFVPEDPETGGSVVVSGDFPVVWKAAPAGVVPSDAGIRINEPSSGAAAGDLPVLTSMAGGSVFWLLTPGTLESPPAGTLWSTGGSPVTIPLTGTGTLTLFAGQSESPPFFRQVITVTENHPDWRSVSANAGNSRILFWADGTAGYDPADATAYIDPQMALGAAGSDPSRVTALGNGGSITLTFPGTVSNGPGADLAVFENGLLYGDGSVFAELAFVEVSSDGIHFARFGTSSLPGPAIGTYEAVPRGSFRGFAGGAPAGYGTLFDLNDLLNSPEVLDGLVDPSAVTHVRIVDADAGSGATDSFGRAVRDPLGTWGSAGFDLDGVAVINGGSP
jgi:hypothetical protein